MNDKYMPINDLLSLLSIKYDADSKEMSGTLLATYVLSGCHTVSYSYRPDKNKAAQIALRMICRSPAILAFGKCLQQLFKKPDNILLLFMVITALSHLTSFVSIFLQQRNRILEYCRELKIHFITMF